MSDTKEQERDEQASRPAEASEDLRKPYEAPKLMKKRSVARATLFTAMGAMGSITSMG